MVTIKVWIEGTTPLLVNRATEEALSGKTRSLGIGDAEDPRDIAERVVYRLPNGQCSVPGAYFTRMVREAGGSHKATGSRKSLKYLVPAALIVVDEQCGLYLRDRKTSITDYEVDARSVVNPSTKGRIMRYRPRYNEWATTFTLKLKEDLISEAMIRQLFTEGLERLGVGDYRPSSGGSFGCSSIVCWDLVSERKNKTIAQLRNTALV
jgi:hypothetical protein